MAKRIRVPGLVDVILVSEPAEIFALNDEPRLDRRFAARGPLANRFIAGRIRRWFQVNGLPLPSLSRRGDAVRAERQKSLAAELDPAAGRPLWTEAQVERLASYVRGESTRAEAAIEAQEIVGRNFFAEFNADTASWQAAAMVDDFRDGFSLKQIAWIVTGRLRRAFDLLTRRAQDDRHALHGIAIGVHGIIGALDRMRALHAGADRLSLSEEAAIARALAPPKRVARVVEEGFPTPASARRTSPGTIVFLDLGKAGVAAPDAGTVFMRGRWNFCPAEAFVTELVRRSGAKRAEAGDGAMSDDVIFTPLRFRNLDVKNRIFRSNISGRFDNDDGSLTQTRINWECKFAKGGIGAIISSYVAGAHRRADHRRATPRIHRDDFDPAVGRARRGRPQLRLQVHHAALSHSGRQMDVPGVHNDARPTLTSTSARNRCTASSARR